MIFESDTDLQRLKWVFSSCKNGVWGAEPDGETDVVCIRAADFDGRLGRLNDGKRTLRSIDSETYEKLALQRGDIIVEKSGGGEKKLVGRAVIYDDTDPSVTSNFLARCRPAADMEPAFINYLWLAIYNGRGTFPHLKQSTGIQNLDLVSFLDVHVRIPSIKTQQQIARFLDDKTERIDELIKKKRELLKCLAEKRQALITLAVTKGIGPNNPIKFSGIGLASDSSANQTEESNSIAKIPEKILEAYQELPQHWRLEKLKFFADIRNSSVDKIISEDEKPVWLCNYTDVYYNDQIMPDMQFLRGSATEMEIKRFQLKRGQVIITKDSEEWEDIGVPALVTEDMSEVLCGYHLSVFEPGSELDAGFLAWLCRAEPLNDQFKLAANGVTRFGLGQHSMKNAFITLPPLKTQQHIAQFLDENTAQIDQTVEKIEDSITQMEEYRSALITAAVTGQLPELQ